MPLRTLRGGRPGAAVAGARHLLPELHVVGGEEPVPALAQPAPPAVINHLDVGDDVIGVEGDLIVTRCRGGQRAVLTLSVSGSANRQEEDPPAASRAGSLTRRLCRGAGRWGGGSRGWRGPGAPCLGRAALRARGSHRDPAERFTQGPEPRPPWGTVGNRLSANTGWTPYPEDFTCHGTTKQLGPDY